MKAVLRSIKPYWLYLILIGKKTVEIGKTFPKSEDWSKTVFLYCSKDMRSFNLIPPKDRVWMLEYLGKVACKFVCTSVTEFSVPYPAHFDSMGYCVSRLLVDAQVTKSAAHNYLKQKNGYGWRITDLIIYDKPRELSEFSKYGFGHPVPLKRPPQSWMYVEVEG